MQAGGESFSHSHYLFHLYLGYSIHFMQNIPLPMQKMKAKKLRFTIVVDDG